MKFTCLEKTAMSSLKDSEEQTSPPATPGSRGVHVANSHFSNINANNGNNGCLKSEPIEKKKINHKSAVKMSEIEQFHRVHMRNG